MPADSEPLISIAMAALNSANYIGDALASLVPAVSGRPIEIVLADGGSGDGTVQQARAVAAQHGLTMTVLHGRDGGLYDGMNRAIAASRGHFVLILNSDDRLRQGALERLVAAADQADVVTGGAAIVGMGPPQVIRNDRWPMSERSIMFGVPAVNARLFERIFLRRVGLLREDLGFAADREFLLRVRTVGGRRRAIEGVVYEYRAHSGSHTIGGTNAARMRVHRANREIAERLLADCASASALWRTLRELQATSMIKLLALHLLSRNEMSNTPWALARSILTVGSAALTGPGLALAWRGRGSGW
jgi:glycosyltransferase involved in cell wall biosynthesis